MLNPYFVLEDEVKFCKENDILIESWSPLAQSGHGLLDDLLLAEIAKKHDRSVAQVCLRWNAHHGNVVLVKSITPDRMV
jgi:diketogulonate reductase-like aldo/keto reductase